MEPFATLAELQDRLDWDLSEAEERDALGALEDASDLARAYGKGWVDSSSAPRLVRTLVLTSCKRYMKNPDGYTTSRAGDETLSWNEIGDKAGSVYFTDEEIKMLKGLAGRAAGLVSAPISAYGTKAPMKPGYVPVDYTGFYPDGHGGITLAGDFFPFFATRDNTVIPAETPREPR